MDSEIKIKDERTKTESPERAETPEKNKPAKKGPSWWIKFKSIKHFELIVAAVAVAVLLLIYVGVSGLTKNDAVTGTSAGDEKFAQQIENVLTQVEGVGKVKVMVTYKTDKASDAKDSDAVSTTEIEGIIVVAQGGADPVVKFNIIKALQVALNIDSGKIQVLPMK